MAAKKPASSSPAAPAKSKKPILGGKNHHRDVPKAFRGSGNRTILMSDRRFFKEGNAILKAENRRKSAKPTEDK